MNSAIIEVYGASVFQNVSFRRFYLCDCLSAVFAGGETETRETAKALPDKIGDFRGGSASIVISMRRRLECTELQRLTSELTWLRTAMLLMWHVTRTQNDSSAYALMTASRLRSASEIKIGGIGTASIVNRRAGLNLLRAMRLCNVVTESKRSCCPGRIGPTGERIRPTTR